MIAARVRLVGYRLDTGQYLVLKINGMKLSDVLTVRKCTFPVCFVTCTVNDNRNHIVYSTIRTHFLQ